MSMGSGVSCVSFAYYFDHDTARIDRGRLFRACSFNAFILIAGVLASQKGRWYRQSCKAK